MTILTRRQSILAVLSMALGSVRGWAAQDTRGGRPVLRIPLDQWSGIIVEYKGKQIPFSAEEIYLTLEKIE